MYFSAACGTQRNRTYNPGSHSGCVRNRYGGDEDHWYHRRGGLSSSLEYYRIMNEKVQNGLGGDHSARILMYSIEFGEFSNQERLAAPGNWDP
jgi:hypothetical protein